MGNKCPYFSDEELENLRVSLISNHYKYLSQEEFNNFKENDFSHLKNSIENINQKLNFIKGQIWGFVAIPSIVGTIIGIIFTITKFF